jgi:hypothetical protein
MLSFAVPTLAERREDPVARVAFYAYCLFTFVIAPAQRYPCVTCGQPGPAQWCNNCDMAGNHPLAGPPHFQPHLITPMCNACIHDNVKCLVCDVHPEDGPPDEAFNVGPASVHGWLV